MAGPGGGASIGGGARPFPPGDYPVVIVGSGPGGLQLSYSLRHLGIRHAILSADPGAGGMFRKWPVFQRLLSWTKPYAEGGPGSRNFERLDWNSLLPEEMEHRSLQARHMDGTSYFPSRPEMEANLVDFAARTKLEVRYDCRWESTRRDEDADGPIFTIETSDGAYRTRCAVFAVGVAEPNRPAIPGVEHAHHYAEVRAAESYAGRRVFLIGKHNSGFELASGLLPWARSIVLASPSPAKLSTMTNSLTGVRARYAQPFEDNVLGGGVGVVDGAIGGIAPEGNALKVIVRPTAGGESLEFIVDDVINATGFISPLRDLGQLGVAMFGASMLPAQTQWWESATVPGIHFAGTITQAVPGLSKHGIPPNSGAVQGYRYNARILASRLAETKFGRRRPRPTIGPAQLSAFLLDEAARGPDLWHQKGFLARAVTLAADGGLHDQGVVPLTAFLDAAALHGEPAEEARRDGMALTVETDGSGAIYPVVYVRRNGRTSEHILPGSAKLDFECAEHARALGSALASLGLRPG